MRAPPFKANEWIPEAAIDSSIGHALPTDDAQASAKAVLKELLIEMRRPNVLSVAGVLGRYANDVRLTSLDAKAEFEQALLVHIFSSPVDVSLLDAACDLFAWETSNRHFGTRANLVQRVLRHQSLRHVLAAGKIEDRRDLDEAVRLYRIFQQQPKVRVEPWQIVNANRLLERFGGFKQELGERYNAEAFDWWRQMLASNPTLLASYQENKPAQQARRAGAEASICCGLSSPSWERLWAICPLAPRAMSRVRAPHPRMSAISKHHPRRSYRRHLRTILT
jgi:hypothetical protein